MTTDTDVVNSDERIVKVREIVEGKETVFYAIRDVNLDYWRSVHSMDDYAAWTRDRHQRAEFDSREEAEEQLEYMCQWRRENP